MLRAPVQMVEPAYPGFGTFEASPS